MKFIATLSATLLLSCSIATLASAGETHKHTSLKNSNNTKDSMVYVTNHTGYTYTVYADYPYSSDHYVDDLAPYARIPQPYYVVPGDPVCLSAVRWVDHYFMNMGCYDYSANVYIEPYGSENSKEKLMIHVDKS